MKKIAFALLAIVGFSTANAQDHSILLYGNAGYNSTTEPSKVVNSNWHINPGVGFQFDKHWTAGIEIDWTQTATKDTASNRVNTNNYMAGLFVRYVHQIGNTHFFCYPQLGAGYQGQYTALPNSSTTDKASGMYVYLTPNLGYSLGRGFAVYASYGRLGYNTLKPSDATPGNPDKNATKTFNFSFDDGFSFGLSKNFACKTQHHHHDANSEMHSSGNSNDDAADEDGDKPMKKKKHHKDSDKDDE